MSKKEDKAKMVLGGLRRAATGFVSEGIFFKDDRESDNRKKLLIWTLLRDSNANIFAGNFFTGLLLYLNLSDSFIGLMSMFSTGANMLQFLAPLLLERFKSRKKILILMRGGMHLFNIVIIGITPMLPVSLQIKMILISSSVIVANVMGALMSPGVSIWHLQFLPHNVRARYFSMFTMLNGICVAVVTLLSSTLVDIFRAGGNEYPALLGLRVLATLLAAVDLIILWRMDEGEYEGAGKIRVRDVLIKPFSEKMYLKTVAVTLLWNLVANIPGSFYTVYLLRDLNVAYSFITLVSLTNIPILIFLTPIWNKVMRRFTFFETLSISMGLYLMHYVLLSLVGAKTIFIYPLAVIFANVMAVGINLSFANIPYVNMPKENQTIYLGFYSTIANFGALIGVTLGREVISRTDGIVLNILGMQMINKQYYLLLVAALMAVAAATIYIIHRNKKKVSA